MRTVSLAILSSFIATFPLVQKKKVTFNTKQHMMDKGIETFIEEIKQIIDDSRSKALRSVDFCRVQMYWAIG